MANGYMRAGAALGEAIAGNGRSAYNDQMNTEYKLAYALEQARQARNARVLGDQNVAKRQVIDNPDLLGQVLGGDANARNQYMTAVMLANENVNPDVLGSLQKTIMTQAGHDAATLGDYDRANQHLFAIGGAKQLSRIDEQNLMQNQYVTGGGGLSTTDQGRANIRRNDASAASSYASADNSRASAARTRQAMSLDRADVLGGGGGKPASKAPSGYRWAANGSLEAIPGGPADKPLGSGATEDERKAAGWLGQATRALSNMEQSLYQKDKDGAFVLDAMGQRIPSGADTPGFIERYSPSEELGNRSMSPDRQRYANAASSLSEALLRAATGAGVNESEARQKVAELTPQRGDSEAVKKQKLAGAAGYIEDLRARAGRALPAAARTLGDPPAAAGARRRYNPATGRVE